VAELERIRGGSSSASPTEVAPQALSWPERIASYKAYAESRNWPDTIAIDNHGWVFGFWICGNNYTVKSGYYGGYPRTYLERVRALFPDKRRVLHLFSGMVDLSILPGHTVDLRPELNPTYLDDAQTLECVPLEQYDLVLADPPYSGEDAEHYGIPMVKRNRVMQRLRRLPSGAHIVWLDTWHNMFSGAVLRQEAGIGIQRSTNHHYRQATIWRRL
jgi:hypothetical protein